MGWAFIRLIDYLDWMQLVEIIYRTRDVMNVGNVTFLSTDSLFTWGHIETCLLRGLDGRFATLFRLRTTPTGRCENVQDRSPRQCNHVIKCTNSFLNIIAALTYSCVSMYVAHRSSSIEAHVVVIHPGQRRVQAHHRFS